MSNCSVRYANTHASSSIMYFSHACKTCMLIFKFLTEILKATSKKSNGKETTAIIKFDTGIINILH